MLWKMNGTESVEPLPSMSTCSNRSIVARVAMKNYNVPVYNENLIIVWVIN